MGIWPRFEPETATRNRKPLEPPIALGARWELRLGPDDRFRVFYRVHAEERQVRILAGSASRAREQNGSEKKRRTGK